MANIARPELRRIYSYIFPRPREMENGKPAGIGRRQRLYDAIKPYGGSLPSAVPEEITSLLTQYGGGTGRLELGYANQFVLFRIVFTYDEYEALRQVQENTPSKPVQVGGVSTLEAGPYELQLIYNAVFRHLDETSQEALEAHGLLEELKYFAMVKKVSGVKDVLNKIYQSKLVYAEDRVHPSVVLEVSDDIANQIISLFKENTRGLEPYGEGDAPCLAKAGDECY